MLWIRSDKTLWKASFRRREITDVIPLLFLQRGAILHSGNAPTIKITLWGLSTPQNAPFLGAIYPQKRCTFANVVGSYAINVSPTCFQSRPTHPVISAFYTILLRFSWDIGIFSITTPLTANMEDRMMKVIRTLYMYIGRWKACFLSDLYTAQRKIPVDLHFLRHLL